MSVTADGSEQDSRLWFERAMEAAAWVLEEIDRQASAATATDDQSTTTTGDESSTADGEPIKKPRKPRQLDDKKVKITEALKANRARVLAVYSTHNQIDAPYEEVKDLLIGPFASLRALRPSKRWTNQEAKGYTLIYHGVPITNTLLNVSADAATKRGLTMNINNRETAVRIYIDLERVLNQ
jgi:hypothetical protein